MTALALFDRLTEAGLNEFYDWMAYETEQTQTCQQYAQHPTTDQLLAWYSHDPAAAEGEVER